MLITGQKCDLLKHANQALPVMNVFSTNNGLTSFDLKLCGRCALARYGYLQ